jgi:hypothetical protein
VTKLALIASTNPTAIIVAHPRASFVFQLH